MDKTIWFTNAFIVNTFMYAMGGTGVNMTYVVGMVNRFMQNLDKINWGVVKDIMWYVRGVWN